MEKNYGNIRKACCMSQENREEESKVGKGAKIFIYILIAICGLILCYVAFVKLLIKLS